MQLTGAVGSDPISAVGLVDRARYVDAWLLALVPGAPASCAAAGRFHPCCIGPGRDGLPCAGTAGDGRHDGRLERHVRHRRHRRRRGDVPERHQRDPRHRFSRPCTRTPGVIVFPPYDGITHACGPDPIRRRGAGLVQPMCSARRRRSFRAAWPNGHRSVRRGAAVPAAPRGRARPTVGQPDARRLRARIDGRAGPGEHGSGGDGGRGVLGRGWAFEALEDVGRNCRSEHRQYRRRRGALRPCGARSVPTCWALRSSGRWQRRTRSPWAALLGGACCGAMLVAGAARLGTLVFDRTFEPNDATRGYYAEKLGTASCTRR